LQLWSVHFHSTGKLVGKDSGILQIGFLDNNAADLSFRREIMKKIALACLFLIVAAGANAGVIHDIQTGLVDTGTLQTPFGVVVAVYTNGIWIAEEPYGAYDGIWVYMGSADPITVVPGDYVAVCGEYKEYYDLSEIDVVAAGLYGSVLNMNTPMAVPTPSFVSAADLAADPEPWESCAITITNGMSVTTAPSSYGEWYATTLDGHEIMFDDFWYDDTTVAVGDCYNNATGIWHFAYGAFRLEAYADGISLVDCNVDTETSTLSSLKALYR
jgi:hypothetical protein